MQVSDSEQLLQRAAADIARRQLRLPLQERGQHGRIDIGGSRHEQAAAGREVGAQRIACPSIEAVGRQQRDDRLVPELTRRHRRERRAAEGADLEVRALALSPDGRKVAFVARGDVYAASARDGGDAVRVTATPDLEAQVAWAPDSRRVVYVGARGLGQQIYLFDFVTNKETALTSGTATDLSPAFSPDGKSIAFLRDRRELRVLDVESTQSRVLATGSLADAVDQPEPVWSPDGKWIAFFAIGNKSFTNVQLVSVAGGPARPVSSLANVFANSIAWGRDGSYLLFDTRQRTEDGQRNGEAQTTQGHDPVQAASVRHLLLRGWGSDQENRGARGAHRDGGARHGSAAPYASG